MSKTARFVRNVQGWRGDARLFRLDPPLDDGTDTVVVSAVDLGIFIPDYRTSETMVFPWDPVADKVRDFGEIGFVPYKSHADALEDMGYAVAS